MVAFSRLALLAVATLCSAQSFSDPPADLPNDTRSSGVALPTNGPSECGEPGHLDGKGSAYPTGTFGVPQPTALPSVIDNISNPQELAGAPQAPRYPKSQSPSDRPDGAARPTDKRSLHRSGKKYRSGAAAPTGDLPTRLYNVPSANLPGLDNRQTRMTNGARLHSRKHKRPFKTPGAGVVPPNGARPTGAQRPSKTQRAGKAKTERAGVTARPTGAPEGV